MEGPQASGPAREAQELDTGRQADLFAQPLQRFRQPGSLRLGHELCGAWAGRRLSLICVAAVLLGKGFGLYRPAQPLSADPRDRSIRPWRRRQAGQYDSARAVDAPKPSDETRAR